MIRGQKFLIDSYTPLSNPILTMIIYYYTPSRTDISLQLACQHLILKKFRLSNKQLRSCYCLPSITCYIESNTDNFVARYYYKSILSLYSKFRSRRCRKLS